MGTAPATNTYLTSGPNAAVGQREDLSDIIVRLEPQDTPFYTRARKSTAKAIRTDWQTQDLKNPDSTNQQQEGFTFAAEQILPTVRLDNIHSIASKEITISESLEAVDKAGRNSEMAYQKVLKGIELKRDVEDGLLYNRAKDASDPRMAAGFPTWMTGNQINVGAGGTPPTGDGSDTYTQGTTAAMNKDDIDDVLEACYNEGGTINWFLMSPLQRRKFSLLGLGSAPTEAVTNQLHMTAPKSATMIGTVGYYYSDFGTHEIVMGRYTDQESMFLIDNRHYEFCTLPGRNFVATRIAKVGDAENWMLTAEWTLKVNAPKAHGALVALSTS